MAPMRAKNGWIYILSEHAVVIGLCLRLFLAWVLPWLLDNERFIPGVAYTDIDLYVKRVRGTNGVVVSQLVGYVACYADYLACS